MNLSPQVRRRTGHGSTMLKCIVCGERAYSIRVSGRSISYRSKEGVIRRKHTCGVHSFHSWEIPPLRSLTFIDPNPRVPIRPLVEWLEKERISRDIPIEDFVELLGITSRTYRAWKNQSPTRPGRGPRQTTTIDYAERLLWTYDRIHLDEVVDLDDLIRIPTMIENEQEHDQ